jgi:hypothetical protein
MTRQVLVLVCAVLLSGLVTAGTPESEATRIVAAYLKMPQPEDDPAGKVRSERLQILSALKAVPDEATDAVGRALPQVKDSRQRVELAEALGVQVQTKAAATLLCELLKDPNDKVRWQAIHGLRLLSSRTNRTGGRRVLSYPDPRSSQERERATRQAMQAGTLSSTRRTVEPKDERNEAYVEFAPKIEGLVPYLVTAANDEVEGNRVNALYALADTRDPAAVVELHRRLKDPGDKVRLCAACFLTEYQDASGLSEMQAALVHLRRTDPGTDSEGDFEYYGQVERLLASFERITGKSFGRVPMNPRLSSDTRQIGELEKQYRNLLHAWAQWWAWEPPTDSQAGPLKSRPVTIGSDSAD